MPPPVSHELYERISRMMVHVPAWAEAKLWQLIEEVYEEGEMAGRSRTAGTRS